MNEGEKFLENEFEGYSTSIIPISAAMVRDRLGESVEGSVNCGSTSKNRPFSS
jgi:hypothetical protein